MRAESSLAGGVSGVLGSPHYADLLPGWLANETFPLWTQPEDISTLGVRDEVCPGGLNGGPLDLSALPVARR